MTRGRSRLRPRLHGKVCATCRHPLLDEDGDETHDNDGYCLVELPGSVAGARAYCGCKGKEFNEMEDAMIDAHGFDGFSRYTI